jgi:hypothetical protein
MLELLKCEEDERMCLWGPQLAVKLRSGIDENETETGKGRKDEHRS